MGYCRGRRVLAVWHIRIVHRYAAFLYIGFGWLLVLALPAVLRAMDAPELVLLTAGGHPLHRRGDRPVAEATEPEPRIFGYHEVWHAMTLMAAGCHYVLVLLLVRG